MSIFSSYGSQWPFLKTLRVMRGNEFAKMKLNKLGRRKGESWKTQGESKGKENYFLWEVRQRMPHRLKWGILCQVLKEEEEMPRLLLVLGKKLMVEPSCEWLSPTRVFLAPYFSRSLKSTKNFLKPFCNVFVVVVQPLIMSDSLRPLDCSTAGFPLLHYLLEFAQTRVHWVDNAIQPLIILCHPFSSCTQSFPASCLSTSKS